MKTYLEEPVKLSELKKWISDKNKNPRSGRKIKSTSRIYKYLEEKWNEYNSKRNIEEFTWKDCKDDKEPITLDIIWEIKDSKKIKGEINENEMIYYQDKNKMVRGFLVSSLIRMKDMNCHKHPITNEFIPESVFEIASIKYKKLTDLNMIEKIEENVIIDIDKKALSVFQKLSLDTFFIDHLEFVNSLTNKSQLIKLNSEIKDFYDKNLDEKTKLKLHPPSGIAFNKDSSELDNLSVDDIKHYILDEMNFILTNGPKNHMVKYIIVGSLAIVIPKIKEIYGDGFSFSFMI